MCETCRTKWRDQILCAACVSRLLESKEASPEQSKTHLRQALLALGLGVGAWVVYVVAVVLLVVAVGAAQLQGQGPPTASPGLLVVILILLVLRTMEAFKVFDLIWIMTHGGPANSTQTIAIYAYQTAYQGFDFGRGAALGYLIALVIMVLAAIYLLMNRLR